MPEVSIDTPGVSIKLVANDTSVEALAKLGMDMFKEAVAIDKGLSPGSSVVGFATENRSIMEIEER